MQVVKRIAIGLAIIFAVLVEVVACVDEGGQIEYADPADVLLNQ